ncbi:hypothetical protein [Trujillonella humicola]
MLQLGISVGAPTSVPALLDGRPMVAVPEAAHRPAEDVGRERIDSGDPA